MIFGSFEKATFRKRLNRFAVEAELEGEPVKAHLPNPGRLWEILLPGRVLFLKKAKGVLPYTVWAAEKGDSVICLHTQYTNSVAEWLISEGLVDFDGCKIKRKEFFLRGHRMDFLLEGKGKRIPLEVKSCTLCSGKLAMFPDAVTERGRKHLQVLAEAGGALFFLVHCPKVDYFLPDFHTDRLFSETLYQLKERINIKAISIGWNDKLEFRPVKELSIPWRIYEKEALDRGSYLLCGSMTEDISLQIGALGRTRFRNGYYIYTGSAMNSLSSRVARHLRITDKKKRWHIDYLVPYLENKKAIPIHSSEDLECKLSEALAAICEDRIENFGSSDCSCESHLFWRKDDPFLDERFVEVILKFRMGRLSAMLP